MRLNKSFRFAPRLLLRADRFSPADRFSHTARFSPISAASIVSTPPNRADAGRFSPTKLEGERAELDTLSRQK